MKNYFVLIEYYTSSSSVPVDNESMLLTNYKGCLDAWRNIVNAASANLTDKGLSRFTVVKFEEVA